MCILVRVLLIIMLPHCTFPQNLDIVDGIVRRMELRCVVMVVDSWKKLQSIRKENFGKLEVQMKVVLVSDLEKMRNLGKMGRCGVFLDLRTDEIKISNYVNTILEINNFDQDIFKSIHWFIFLTKEESVELVFKYDSKVFLLLEDGRDIKVVESYSVEDDIKINTVIGTWLSVTGTLGNWFEK